MGAPVIASDTPPVAEFVHDGQNGLLTPCLDPARLAERILEVLEDGRLARRLGAAARRYAERHLRVADYLANYRALTTRLMRDGPI